MRKILFACWSLSSLFRWEQKFIRSLSSCVTGTSAVQCHYQGCHHGGPGHPGHGQPSHLDQGGPPAARALHWAGGPLLLPTIGNMRGFLFLPTQVHLQCEDPACLQEFPGRLKDQCLLAFHRICQSVWRLEWTPIRLTEFIFCLAWELAHHFT